MDILQTAIQTLKRNLLLLIILVSVAITAGLIHGKMQKSTYVTQFTITDGLVKFGAVQTYNNFIAPDNRYYDLEDSELKRIRLSFEKFTISYSQDNANSIMFTLVTGNKTLDHRVVQEDILDLLNSNRLLKQSLSYRKSIMNRKVDFLEVKIAQLDTILASPNTFMPNFSAPNDSYLLFSDMIELENQLNQMGHFEPLLETGTALEKRKPIVMFMALYMVLAALLFLVVSKKVRVKKIEE